MKQKEQTAATAAADKYTFIWWWAELSFIYPIKRGKKSIFWTIIQLYEIVQFFFLLYFASFIDVRTIDQPVEVNKTKTYTLCVYVCMWE